jgi:TatD DNase family protein
MILFDTHTHLYLDNFDNDRAELMARAAAVGVQKFYLPAIDSTETDRLLQMEKDYPHQCFAMMGLHPCYVKENWQQELAHVQHHLAQRPFAAVGEIGLDLYWDTTFFEQQQEAFHQQIQWALQYGLPIVIHSRNATPQTIAIMQQYQPQGLRGIFHCFGGSYEEAAQIVETGFYLGIGGVVTYKKSGLAETLARVPLQHLVLETDAPYLTPVPFRGKRNESSYLTYIVAKLAEVYGVPEAEVAAVTTANAEAIFKVKSEK